MVCGVEKAHFEIVNTDNLGLADLFSVNPTSCENVDFYVQYLSEYALYDFQTGRAVTHMFIDDVANRIMGFVSLRSSSVLSSDDKGRMLGSPAIEIAVLAGDQQYERRGVGTNLIDYVRIIAEHMQENYLGVRHIVLAADAIAVGFYEKMGFGYMEDRWELMPKEQWSVNCVPMSMHLDFEKKYITPYPDDLDDEW